MNGDERAPDYTCGFFKAFSKDLLVLLTLLDRFDSPCGGEISKLLTSNGSGAAARTDRPRSDGGKTRARRFKERARFVVPFSAYCILLLSKLNKYRIYCSLINIYNCFT